MLNKRREINEIVALTGVSNAGNFQSTELWSKKEGFNKEASFAELYMK